MSTNKILTTAKIDYNKRGEMTNEEEKEKVSPELTTTDEIHQQTTCTPERLLVSYFALGLDHSQWGYQRLD